MWKKLFICLIITSEILSKDKQQCFDYLQSDWEYTCVKRNPIYSGLHTKIFEVSKGSEIYMMKVTKSNPHSQNELQVLLRLSGNRYVPEIYKEKFVDDTLIMIMTNGNYSNLLVAMQDQYQFKETKFILNFFLKIVEGVNIIHRAKFSHNDLKPENILVTSSMDPLIIDYDIAVPLNTNALGQGSPIFIAPENLLAIENNETVYYDEQTDIFALGAILYIMMFKDSPIQSNNKYEDVVNSEISFPKNTPKIIAEIIQGCYTLKEHRYSMKKLIEMVKKAISINPLAPLGIDYKYKMNNNRKIKDDYYFLKYKSYIFIFISISILLGLAYLVYKHWNKLENIDIGVEIKEKDIEKSIHD
jgi:serine/threonine protein kinase